MKKKFTYSFIVLLALLVGGIIAYSVSLDKKLSSNNKSSKIMKDNYMASCVIDPTLYDFCECTFKEFEKNLTLDEWIELGEQAEDLSAFYDNPKVKKAIFRCTDKL